MSDDMDIENELRRFQHDPGPEVRRSVLARFSSGFGSHAPARQKIVFWKKPIPLYVAAACIVVAVGLSFFTGRWTDSSRRPFEEPRSGLRTGNASWAQEVTWEVAPNDLT